MIAGKHRLCFHPVLLYGQFSLARGFEKMSDMAISSARVLIAEDDESNRLVTSAIIKHLGFLADVVSNGKEALQALEQQTYDIILMNVRMPEMDGIRATQLIRKRFPPDRQPLIIAFTACVLPDSREDCIRAGMNDFIAKPVKMEDLNRILCKHIQILEAQKEFQLLTSKAFMGLGKPP